MLRSCLLVVFLRSSKLIVVPRAMGAVLRGERGTTRKHLEQHRRWRCWRKWYRVALGPIQESLCLLTVYRSGVGDGTRASRWGSRQENTLYPPITPLRLHPPSRDKVLGDRTFFLYLYSPVARGLNPQGSSRLNRRLLPSRWHQSNFFHPTHFFRPDLELHDVTRSSNQHPAQKHEI